MDGSGHDRADLTKAPFDRYGRIAIKRDRVPHFRLWLQAAVRSIVIYVRLTSSSGNLDAEFPLLEALRTKLGVPRPVAIDPKRN